jgi:hypothetical protein
MAGSLCEWITEDNMVCRSARASFKRNKRQRNEMLRKIATTPVHLRCRLNERWNDRFWRILLKKSLLADERNFSGPLIRFARRDVRDHNAFYKDDHGPSYRPSEHCSGRNI